MYFGLSKMAKKPGVYTAKNGAKYKILANGKARFISGPTKGKIGVKRKGAKKGGKRWVDGDRRITSHRR